MTKTQSTKALFGEEELPLEDVPCYMCGTDNGDVQFEDGPFEVTRCKDCSFLYVTPRVPDSHLHLIYQTEYFKSSSAKDFGYTDYVKDKAGYLRTFAKKAKIVRRHKPEGKVLEVGSAAGFFLHAMRDKGHEVHGVEVSEFVTDFARKEFNLDTIYNGKLEDAPLEAKPFDIVAMWDVIEHLADPINELKRIGGLMKPDGMLFIQTQDPETMFAKFLGKKWQHFKQLEHVYHFSPKTLKQALDRGGFEIVELRHSGGGKYISVDFFVERMQRYSKLVHWLLKPAQALFGRRFFYLNPHDEMIVVAKLKG